MKSERPRSVRGLPKAKLIEEIERLRDRLARAEGSNRETRSPEEAERLRRQLAEALEQQTATSEILRVIGSSPSDLQPVFDIIAKHATALTDAVYSAVYLVEGEAIHLRAYYSDDIPNTRQFAAAFPMPITSETLIARTLRTGTLANIADMEDISVPEAGRTLARTLGVRSTLTVPMRRGGHPIGAIGVNRRKPGDFTSAEIALLQTFADQAVIAIENVRLFNELQEKNLALTAAHAQTTETLEQQTATSEILRVISQSPTAVQPVFDAVAESAARLCESFDSIIWRPSGDNLAIVAHHGPIPIGPGGLPLTRESVPGRAFLDGRSFHLPDLQAEADEFPVGSDLARRHGFRTTLNVPLMRDSAAIGVITLRRIEVKLFTDRQIELLKTFADQAVIAIENVRLFTELQEKNQALTAAHAQVTESLEQQTATSDILRVISSSPTDVQPVFETIARSATTLCEANLCHLYRYDGDLIHFAAEHGGTPAETTAAQRAFPQAPSRLSVTARAILKAAIVQVADVSEEPEVADSLRMFRTVLSVPMRRDRRPLGAITVARRFVRPFTDKQIELLQTFADQAVIAIENVRLFNETKEALERQTATAEILRVISSSPTDAQPVFDAILRSAVTLCNSLLGNVVRVDGDLVRLVATLHPRPEEVAAIYPAPLTASLPPCRAIRENTVIHVPDVEAAGAIPPAGLQVTRAAGIRSLLVVPMRRDEQPIGAILIARPAVGPFPDEQIALLQTFADQAMIAIENVRLFKELQTSNRDLTTALDKQTATSDILRVISRSQTDIRPVFDTIIASAVRLFGGHTCGLTRVTGDQLELVALTSIDAAADAPVRAAFPQSLQAVGAHPQAIRDRVPLNVADAHADARLAEGERVFAGIRGFRSWVVVPMLRDDVTIGSIGVTRREAGGFTADEIALLQTFADQAVIAIENVRLFKELETRNRDLTESLDRETATGEILRVISSSPTDIQPVLAAILDSGRRLCDAEFGAIFRFENGSFMNTASTTITSEFGAWLRRNPIRPGQGTPLRRIALERRPVQVADILSDPGFGPPDEYRREGMRTALAVPMLKDGGLVGALTFHRRVVKPFTEQQITLLETFAAQAVIAIENVRLFKELEARNRDLTTALDTQTATSEILRVISSSPTDLQPVFDEIVRSAQRLLGARTTSVFRRLGDEIHLVAFTRTGEAADAAYASLFPMSFDEYRERYPFAEPDWVDGTVIHVPDVERDTRSPEVSRIARGRGFRSLVQVPMRRQGQVIGLIGITRREAGAFADDEIKLLQTFADQAVIAIENVRLFKELEARNQELTQAHAQVTEALDQQTATSEILRVIASSPTDIQPVFDAIAQSAARLCPFDAVVYRVDGDVLRPVAHHGSFEVGPLPLLLGTANGRAVIERRLVRVTDLQAEVTEFPEGAAISRREGTRSFVSVPLLREGGAIGTIAVRRFEIRPFSDKQIALLQTFADQAVIAIENVRLFKELQSSNRELTAALEQQTATSDLLKVIGRSTFDLQPVFETLAENTVRLCEAEHSLIYRFDGQILKLVAAYNISPELRAFNALNHIVPGRGSCGGRVVLDRRTVHIHDAQADPEYTFGTGEIDPIRTVVGVPMLRAGELLGVIGVLRYEVRPFTDSQIALLETFADQAAIAIENARLLTELRARTQELTRSVEQLTALGDVGRAVSSSLDLDTVLNTIVDRAVQLSGTDGGTIFEYDEATEEFSARATLNADASQSALLRTTRLRRGEGAVGQMAVTLEPFQIRDIAAEGAYESRIRGAMLASGTRSVLAMPLLHEDRLVGGLVVTRRMAGEFTREVVELLRTFATQSALAIQNARLFREIEVKSRQLEVASQHKSEFLANMSHELRTPLNAIIGFSEVLTDRMFGELNEKQDEYLKDIYASGTHLLSLINDILDLSKIEAGRMELELTDFDLPTAIENALMLVRERAGRRSLTLHKSVDDGVGQLRADERKIRQVVLNLLSNAIKFTPEGGRIEVAAVPKDGLVEVSVSDTGVGIALEDQEKVFEEFRQVGTADKKAEGTGLGLTLCRKFIELHGGKIWVKSEVGVGSTFIFTIPVRHGE